MILPFVAALWDAKTGEIPDYITVPGVVLSFLYGIFVNPHILIDFTVFGVVGFLFYRYGFVGGGDVLLLLALTPFLPSIPLPHFFVLFLSITLTSAFYGVYLKAKENPLYLLPIPFLPPIATPLYGSFLMATIGRRPFVREVDVEELKIEDVLAEPVEGFPKMVIEHGDKEKLRDMGVKRVKILVNLPKMGPFIFLSLLILHLSPDPSLLLLPPVLVLSPLF